MERTISFKPFLKTLCCVSLMSVSLQISFSKELLAQETYNVNEQIRILEDKDYAKHLKQMEKEKALQKKARNRQALLRKQERKTYEKTRKEQVQRRKQQRVQTADESEQKYEQKLKKEHKQQEKSRRQHIAEKKQEQKRLKKQQALNRSRFYKTNPLGDQASPRVDRSKRKFF